MPSEAQTTGRSEPDLRAFRYPEAAWEPPASSGLFRELSAEEIASARRGARDRENGAEDGSVPALPVRYEYRVEPGFDFEAEREVEPGGEDGGDPAGTGARAGEGQSDRHFRQLLAAECAKAEERGLAEGVELGLARGRTEGRTEGRREGREEAIGELEAGVEGERDRLTGQAAALVASFTQARKGYVEALEREAARLALAIAARILRREAEADPLLVSAAVRVALGQLSATTAVRLRVPCSDLALWSEALAHMPNLAIRPEVIGDAGMGLGDCRMETELGVAELGLDAQLEAIEQAFFAGDDFRTPLSAAAECEGASDAG